MNRNELHDITETLTDIYHRLRPPEYSGRNAVVPDFVLRKLQQVIFYIEAVEKAAKENTYGT